VHQKNNFTRRRSVHADVNIIFGDNGVFPLYFLLLKVHRNKKVHRMTATSRKQGACFPAELWEQIQAKADADNTTASKVIVQAVREMFQRRNKRRASK
jgi:hypothetical protein